MPYPFAAAEVLTAANLNAMIGAPAQNNQTGTTYSLALLDAGKTVTLSNASPVTVTVPAQATVTWADNTEINLLNLGAGLVTIAGAVGVTVNGTPLTLAQNARGILIRTASNTWTFVPGVAAAVTPGLTLVTPTSIANSGGSASASGGEVTFTAVNTISLNGVFTSAYANYKVMLNLTDRSITDGTTMRLRAAGSDTTSGTYQWSSARLGAALSGGQDNTATSQFLPFGQLNKKYALTFDIFNAAISAGSNLVGSCYHFDTVNYITVFSGGNTAAVAHDGFTFIPASGTVTGKIRVYGYLNS